MTWPQFTIEDTCLLVTDGTHYTPPNVGEGIPFLTVKDFTHDGQADLMGCSQITKSEFEKADAGNSAPKLGDVLFSKDGTVGKVYVVKSNELFAVLSSMAILRPDKLKLDADYFGWVLKTDSCLDQASRSKTGSAIRRIILKDLKLVKFPLPHKNGKPDLKEQKRIAAILDKAEAIRRKRQQALRLTDDFLRSVFLDMFGDPEAKGWAMTTVEGVARKEKGSMRTGPFGSQLLVSEFVDSGIPVLGIDNAVTNQFSWGKSRFISEEKYAELSRYTVRPGDVLITIMGTCGRCAVVPDDIPTAINTKHLCCITLDHEKCLPEFLHAYFLVHNIARRYLALHSKGAIMDGLNMGIIKGLPVPEVPIHLQKKFADLVTRHTSGKMNLKRQNSKSEDLFASLQQRAFKGEL